MNYFTIVKNVASEIVVDKSCFICNIFHATSKEQVNDLLTSIRKKHPKANHHCYAYVLNQPYYEKFSDDKEPSGTAGQPLMQILKANNLQDVLVVVTRFFGGTKLGVGGLIRAYSESFNSTLLIADKTLVKFCEHYTITFNYDLINVVDKFVKENNITVLTKDYLEQVSYYLYVDNSLMINQLNEYCLGRLIISEKEVLKVIS